MVESIAWWSSVGVLVLASAIDIHSRRVPNWLVFPFLAAGIVTRAATGGVAGAGLSLAGMGVAVLLFGLPCLVRAMGMGDLKLAAGVGAWIGPGQMLTAFVVTAIAGGVMAVGYTVCHRSLGQGLDKTSDLLADLARGKIRPRGQNGPAAPHASIPYAPAIAFGALFSFLAR